ncbi:MAG: calcium/sodium antiporter [Cyclobacteriaceae bacterium]|nr:calcium/sodium antiporter [Cyclobacteriaceae bacterium]MCH8517563.1 calcium/sodium antiporter [Cyclobacteriaceae bacterium]
MILDILLAIVGLVILLFGGEFLVRGASGIALKLRITPMVVGLTIVALGTSAPELFISINAALKGKPDLVMGNIVGSNICNLALVLGVTSLIYPIAVNKNSLKIDWPMTMGSSVLLFLALSEGWRGDEDAYVNDYEGMGFILLLAIYLTFLFINSSKDRKARLELEKSLDIPEDADAIPLWKSFGLILLGGFGLWLGSEWFVGGAVNAAEQVGIDERIVGIVFLSLGTSLPELVTGAIAAFRKETDIALGNLMGSNIFNILSILGITSIIEDIYASDKILYTDMMWMLGITFLILPMMLIRRKITRIEGGILLAIYLYYTFAVVIT